MLSPGSARAIDVHLEVLGADLNVAVLASMRNEYRDALADPTIRRRLAVLAIEVPPPEQLGPKTLGPFHKAEIEKWWPIIKAAGIKGE